MSEKRPPKRVPDKFVRWDSNLGTPGTYPVMTLSSLLIGS